AIDNSKERLEAIVEEAPKWDIGAIAGIPSWVLLMLQAIVKHHQLDHIQDIWPNFRIYASGGVAFETYRKDFEQLSNQPLIIIDTYLASEGFFAYTEKPDSLDMRLALSHGYFYEFIPFDERGVDEHGQILENPEIHSLDQVVKDQDYVIIISSCAGAWRYIIGDTIQFTSLDLPQIKITGRTKFFLNVVGSQLSEEKMDEAIVTTAKALGGTINEYMVAALKNSDGQFIHQWVLVSKDEMDAKEAKQKLDETLQQKNKNYKVARSKALKGIDVKVISKETYNEYLAKTKKVGGQVKTPKVMKEEHMKGLLEFLTYSD
ncbi:MAG: GH3 auxin-responsive promoter family protein, partial [Vicingaceae bacterium]